MTISVISDMHCHGGMFPPYWQPQNMMPADVLAIAGDLGTAKFSEAILENIRKATEGKFKAVVAVYGNHDFYSSVRPDESTPFNVPSLADNFVQTVEDVDFVCSPLWSPITHDELIRNSLNDYNYIPGFTTQKCTELFWKNVEWLEKAVAESRGKGQRIVVMTHHLPRHELISDTFKDSDINEAFCVMDEEAEKRLAALKPELWIHGHSHDFYSKTLDGIRYIRNPVGYARERTSYMADFIENIF